MPTRLSDGKTISTVALVAIVALVALPYFKPRLDRDFFSLCILFCVFVLYYQCKKLAALTQEALDNCNSMSIRYDEMVLEHAKFEDMKMQRTREFNRLANENERLNKECQKHLAKEADFEKEYNRFLHNRSYFYAFRHIILKNKDLLKNDVIVHSPANSDTSYVGKHIDIEFLIFPDLSNYVSDEN